MDTEEYSDPINNDININEVSNLLSDIVSPLCVLALIHEMDS